jgi:hypothetical protein
MVKEVAEVVVGVVLGKTLARRSLQPRKTGFYNPVLTFISLNFIS